MSSHIFLLPGTKAVKVKAETSHQGGGAYFGCHATFIGSFQVAISLYDDPDKELKGIVPDAWGRSSWQETARKHLMQDGPDRDKLFRRFADQYNNYSLVFMTAPCNTDDGKPDNTHHLHGKLATAGFADWLRKQGEFIMGSPLLSNPQHQTSSFSLLRGWMWVPNTHYLGQEQVRHISGTEYISGTMKPALPLKEWWDHYYQFHEKKRLTSIRDKDSPHLGHLVPFEPAELLG